MIDRIRRTPPAELVLWGSIIFIVVLLATTGSFLFGGPAPVQVDQTGTPATGLLVTSVTPAATPLPEELLPPTPTPRPTLPPLDLPELTPPPGGRVIAVTPAPDAVGWTRQNDEVPNHFGDYNIYAGVFDGQAHVGAIRFDLSEVSPGAPILYADLILVGLSKQWLGNGNSHWRIELLEPWMETNWAQTTYARLQRPDGATLELSPSIPAGDLRAGHPNTLVLGPPALDELAARVYSGHVAFRIRGPENGANNMFAWDSGYGAGSRGQTPRLRLVVGQAPETPPPSPTPRYVIVTAVPPTPTPENVMTLAAQVMTATAQATPYAGTGTPTPTATATPLPGNWVTPVVIVPTATPANAATAQVRAQIATAQAVAYGTPTPLPPNVWTATPATPSPTATAVPLLIPVDQMEPTPTGTLTPVPTPTPADLPAVLRGKIAFLSDRLGGDEPAVFVMDPDGSNVALLTNRWVYDRARELDTLSPDRGQRLFVKEYQGNFEIWVQDVVDGGTRYLTGQGRVTYEPAWSPDGGRIAFVGQAAGNDEIYVLNRETGYEDRLTHNTWEWDKHPSWSPDGTQIVFWSNREAGHAQIWLMNADGSDPRNLSNNEYNETDPVWIK